MHLQDFPSFHSSIVTEALIPAPSDFEVQSMIKFLIKFLNALIIAPIEIHRQLCQVCDHTQLDGQHISCRSSAARCLITIHPIAQTSRPVISNFSYTSRRSCSVRVSVFRVRMRRRSVSQWL